jgi:hypothetical protein
MLRKDVPNWARSCIAHARRWSVYALEGVTVHKLLYLLRPGAILIAFIFLGFLTAAILRGRQIPRCFQCGAVKVRPSLPTGFLDLCGSLFQLHPYRCEGCQERFHAFSFSNRSVGSLKG